MPLYEFACGHCGPFTSWRTVDARDQPEPCPDCGTAAERCLSTPSLRLLSTAVRKAHAINERSRHEPSVRRAHQCSSGCGCGTRPSRPKAVKKPQRPWMLGH